MNMHSTLGYELLKTQGINEEILDLVKYHHQNLKHSGYPAINAKDNVQDIGVQIISTADKYSALREARVYRRKLSKIESLLILYKEVLEGAKGEGAKPETSGEGESQTETYYLYLWYGFEEKLITEETDYSSDSHILMKFRVAEGEEDDHEALIEAIRESLRKSKIFLRHIHE